MAAVLRLTRGYGAQPRGLDRTLCLPLLWRPLLHLKCEHAPLSLSLHVGGRIPQVLHRLFLAGIRESQLRGSENEGDFALDEHGAFANFLTNHVQFENALNEILFAGDRALAGIERESVVDQATKRGFVTRNLGRDVLVLDCQNALLFALAWNWCSHDLGIARNLTKDGRRDYCSENSVAQFAWP